MLEAQYILYIKLINIDLKLKSAQMAKRTEKAENTAEELEVLVQKLETRKEELKFENGQRQEEIEQLRLELESNEDKWSRRNKQIKILEEQVKNISQGNSDKEKRLIETAKHMHDRLKALEEENNKQTNIITGNKIFTFFLNSCVLSNFNFSKKC